ncbi:MAG TPA: radical SAM protein, partial [Pontiella sp.]
MSKLAVSLAQLRKYDQPGPRYTSYPPATHFTETPDLIQGGPDPLSLYFHLPFCSTQCLYCGCTNIVTNNRARGAEYLEYIKREVAMRAAFVHDESQVVQLQLGGGTPTFFEPSELEELGRLVRSHFRIADEIEAGVEIDPRSLTEEKVQALRNAGFNRASLGVQDINPDVQKTIARIQPLERIAETNRWLRDSGMESINFDMIYG